MTSNAGAENIISPKHMGFAAAADEKADYNFMKGRVMDELKRLFRPEFLNRIDETIVFHPLTKENIRQISHIMLSAISRRTKEQLDMTLVFDEKAVDWLSEKGYDPKYGARPLRRTIQNEVEDKLSEALLEGRVKAGDTVAVTAEAQGLIFNRSEVPVPAAESV